MRAIIIILLISILGASCHNDESEKAKLDNTLIKQLDSIKAQILNEEILKRKNTSEQSKGADSVKYIYLLKDKETGEIKEFENWPDNWDQKYDYVSNRIETNTP